MSALRISTEPHAAESLRQHVRDHLDTFNVAVTGFAEYHAVSIFLRDERDEVLGGLLGTRSRWLRHRRRRQRRHPRCPRWSSRAV
jgi:hypothetical protein